ncbi:hypothetical protein LXL04_028630 [Taraxacum kok-saghyz]
MKPVRHYQDLRFLLVCDELGGGIPLQIPREQKPRLPVEMLVQMRTIIEIENGGTNMDGTQKYKRWICFNLRPDTLEQESCIHAVDIDSSSCGGIKKKIKKQNKRVNWIHQKLTEHSKDNRVAHDCPGKA